MSKVRMLATVKGSPNGIKVQNYKIGEVYDIDGDLLKCFIDAGVVELANPKKVEITVIETPEIELETQDIKKKRGRK